MILSDTRFLKKNSVYDITFLIFEKAFLKMPNKIEQVQKDIFCLFIHWIIFFNLRITFRHYYYANKSMFLSMVDFCSVFNPIGRCFKFSQNLTFGWEFISTFQKILKKISEGEFTYKP